MGNGSDRSDPSTQADRLKILTRPQQIFVNFQQLSRVGQVGTLVSRGQVKIFDPVRVNLRTSLTGSVFLLQRLSFVADHHPEAVLGAVATGARDLAEPRVARLKQQGDCVTILNQKFVNFYCEMPRGLAV